MRPQVLDHMIERALEVLEQRRHALGIVVERHLLVKNAVVARLFDVRGDAENEPQRIVVEARTDVVVPALGERLVLVISAPVCELGRGDVDDALAGPLGDEVHEAQQVLVRVAKPHAAADARLEIRGAARHVEGDHALVRVPDVDHAVELLVARFERVFREHPGPMLRELGERGIDLRVGRKRLDERLGAGLVDDPGASPTSRLCGFST